MVGMWHINDVRYVVKTVPNCNLFSLRTSVVNNKRNITLPICEKSQYTKKQSGYILFHITLLLVIINTCFFTAESFLESKEFSKHMRQSIQE